ncbi:MAG: hypothetical protein EBZ87_04040, partial [Microbacteriaceae bacterium]|nr:hypothetical protein [Microbacteriaceae bacterium]
MAALIKGQTYPFSGKYNNLMLKLVSTNHPQSGEVNFFGSWMPNKPVFYALTESAYLESNYRIAMGPKLKDYTNFMYLPVESIIEVLLNEDDVVLFTINSTIDDVHLHGATEKQESVIQQQQTTERPLAKMAGVFFRRTGTGVPLFCFGWM